MGDYIKFSIGIPAFKNQFLKECIESVLAQTYQNFELIILNDSSPYPIDEIINKFNNSRIKYYKNESNIGAENVVNNWNKCLKLSSGEFFVLLGDDDKLSPDYLKEFNSLIKRYPDLDVYHCRSRIINESGHPIMLTPSCPEYETVYDNIWHRITERRAQFISDFVYRTVPLKEKGGFYYLPLAWGSDDITAYLACTEKGIAHTNRPVFNYRSNSLSITSTGNEYLKMKAHQLYAKWLQNFLSVPPKNADEELIYNDINQNLQIYLQKRKVLAIAKSMERSPVQQLFMWILNLRGSDVSYKEVAIAFLAGLKRRSARVR